MTLRPWFKLDDRALGYGLIVAFILMIACFAGSTLFSLEISKDITTASESIAGNAGPSVLALTPIHTELRQLEVSLDEYSERGSPAYKQEQELKRSLQGMDNGIQVYFSTPLYEGEKELMVEIESESRMLQAAIERTIALVHSNPGEARRFVDDRVKPLIDDLDDDLIAASRLNITNATRLAHEISERREHVQRTAILLDTLSAGLGLGLLVILVRGLKRYVELLRFRQESLELRANELGSFANRVAHDIRGPLQSLGLALELADRKATEAGVQSMLGRALRGLKRVRGIVDGLYEFASSGARPGPGVHCDAYAVLSEVVDDLRPVAEEAKIELGFEPRTRGEAACSVGVLSTIADNLIRNAIKYIGDGPLRRVTLRLLDAGPALRLEVQDTGPGIPPALQRIIFEPYARAPGATQPGIGLGLATVKRLAVAHGGTVGVESGPGQGARFWVDLAKYQSAPFALATAPS